MRRQIARLEYHLYMYMCVCVCVCVENVFESEEKVSLTEKFISTQLKSNFKI